MAESLSGEPTGSDISQPGRDLGLHQKLDGLVVVTVREPLVAVSDCRMRRFVLHIVEG